MTFTTGAWSVDGNTTDAQLARLMAQAANLGSQGVVGSLDCQVQANSPATAGINITAGGVVVLGVESPYQGAYTSWNIGIDSTLSIASTGSGGGRSDMVVIRAEDPTWEDSPWGTPAAGQILWPRVLSNVGAGATTVPGGYSAIPLARIDMPASTAAVQQSYIHDLRQVCNPQRQMAMVAVNGPSSEANWTVSTTPHAWPPGASWPVYIPPWATVMVTAWWLNEIPWNTTPGTWARGWIYPVLGSVGSPTLTWPQTLISIPQAQGPYRHTIGGGGIVSIGPTLRGTTQTLNVAQTTDGTQNGVMGFDEGSSFTMLYEFQALAALN